MNDGLRQSLAIAAGGALGAVARFWVATLVRSSIATAFPLGIFLVNVSGAFLMGLVMVLVSERLTPETGQTLLLIGAVGFLGGYTTFSSLAYDTVALGQSGQLMLAILNQVGSAAAGLVAVWLGILAGRAL